MSNRLRADEILARLRAGLRYATVEYDADADELEVRLSNVSRRAGYAVLLEDDAYLRVDPDTHEPLSIMLFPFSLWLERHAGAAAADELLQHPPADQFSSWVFPGPLLRHWGGQAAGTIEQTVRDSGALARLAA